MDWPRAVVAARDGRVWAAGSHDDTAATSVLEGSRWSLQLHPHLSWCIDERAAHESADGSIWFGSAADFVPAKGQVGGVLQFRAGEWTHHRPPSAPKAVYAFARAQDGTLWFGRRGLHRYDGQRWTHTQEIGGLTPWVHAVHASQDGSLWVGTRAYGILHGSGGNWVRFSVRDGLPSNTVTDLCSTGDGVLWAVTRGGVCRYDGQSWRVCPAPLDQDGGWSGTSMPSGAGGVWISDPSMRAVHYVPDPLPPQTGITLEVRQVSQPGNTTLAWEGADPWRTTPASQLEFSWRLDAGTWSPFNRATSKVFEALSAGSHTFEVVARDADLNVDPTPAELRFSVAFPVWRQPWFAGLVFLGLGLVAVQTVRVVRRDQALHVANAELEKRVESRTLELRAANRQLEAEVSERRSAEGALRTSERRYRDLSREILLLQEEERRRVARELHDGVNQSLSSLKFSLEGIEEQIPRTPGPVHEEASRARDRLDEAIQEIRRISQNLRPSVLDDLGLEAATRSLCEGFGGRAGTKVELGLGGIPGSLPAELETALYRILQEALTNVERHAQASSVRLRLRSEDAHMVMRVIDDGVGFDVSAVTGDEGTGLRNMRERAALLEGNLAVHSAPGEGTEVCVRLPLASRTGDDDA